MLSFVFAAALLAAVLAAAVIRPGGLPEAVVAVPAAALAVVAGLVGTDVALAEVVELAPTRGVPGRGARPWSPRGPGRPVRLAGRVAGPGVAGKPRNLFGLVVLAAAGTTAVLSLDATVVLLTPVVLATVDRGRDARPHLYACGHLANSASTLLPVSNLTNLLALGASGLTFLGFTALMALPWVAAVVVEYALLGWYFRGALRNGDGREPPARTPVPRFALVAVGSTLVVFGAASLVGIEPVWPAAVGAAVLGVRALVRERITPLRLVLSASPQFCLFVLAVGVVVAAVGASGLTAALRVVLPTETTLPGLLAMAGLAAVLANVVNNLPAALLLLEVLGPGAPTGLVLAMLLGVNMGPNLTYAGSLATLLWRRVLRGADASPRLGEFTAVGALTTPTALAAAVVALWVVL